MRLKLRKAQAAAGDIVLLFCDESEALTHPYLARAWARRGADLRVPAPGQARKVAMMGTLDWGRRKLVVTTARRKRSSDFIAHLEELDRLYGPKPAAPIEPVVIVLDNGPVHTSKASRAAPSAIAPELTTMTSVPPCRNAAMSCASEASHAPRAAPEPPTSSDDPTLSTRRGQWLASASWDSADKDIARRLSPVRRSG